MATGGGEPMATAASPFEEKTEPVGRLLGRALPPWWLMLITGASWTVIAVILLRFDYTSVYSISLLFGFVAIAAGVLEVGMIVLAQGWWKLLNAILAVVYR